MDVALENGHKVISTSCKPENLPKFKAARDDNFLAVALDVTDKDSIENAFKAALDKFKQIDVVCNNAGFGLSGVFESLSEKQIRMQMGKYFHQSTSGTKLIVPNNSTHLPSSFTIPYTEVNFFGLMWVTKMAVQASLSGRSLRTTQESLNAIACRS